MRYETFLTHFSLKNLLSRREAASGYKKHLKKSNFSFIPLLLAISVVQNYSCPRAVILCCFRDVVELSRVQGGPDYSLK